MPAAVGHLPTTLTLRSKRGRARNLEHLRVHPASTDISFMKQVVEFDMTCCCRRDVAGALGANVHCGTQRSGSSLYFSGPSPRRCMTHDRARELERLEHACVRSSLRGRERSCRLSLQLICSCERIDGSFFGRRLNGSRLGQLAVLPGAETLTSASSELISCRSEE